jgi:hypothetical protein
MADSFHAPAETVSLRDDRLTWIPEGEFCALVILIEASANSTF